MKSSASMYESSDLQFLRTIPGKQSVQAALDESRFIMTFPTILGVMEILCSFRLVLEGKAGKEIRESSRLVFLEKFLTNYFALSDAEDNTSKRLNRGGIADLSLLKTLLGICQKSHKPRSLELMYSFISLAYASFAASRTFLQ